MSFTIVTANHNGGLFPENSLISIIGKKNKVVELERIIADGNSSDNSHKILEKYSSDITKLIIEKDAGRFAPLTLLHHFAKRGIIGISSLISLQRDMK
jgi:hypothetical protein